MAGNRKPPVSMEHQTPSAKKTIKERIHKALAKRRETALPEERLNPLGIPLLPKSRPNNLTPCPTNESAASIALSNYGTFGQLPYDIRRIILEYALGGRRLLADLRFDYPHYKKRTKSFLPVPSWFERDPRRIDYSKPKRWHWFGCEYHDDLMVVQPELLPGEEWTANHRAIWSHASGSSYKRREISWRERRKTEEYDSHNVGAMGWLLSCRQAYDEGINILYANNSFVVSQADNLTQLTRLILPQRLAHLRSLHVVDGCYADAESSLTTLDFDKPIKPLETHVRKYLDIGQALAGHCPNLITWRTSIYWDMWSVDRLRMEPGPVWTAVLILDSIEQAYHKLGFALNKEFSIDVQLGAWKVLRQLYTHQLGDRVKTEGDLWEKKFWKPLGEGKNEGYWVRIGWNDESDFLSWAVERWRVQPHMGPWYPVWEEEPSRP